MTDKQLENYPKTKVTYPLDMGIEDSKNFKAELSEFIEEKLGKRAYLCCISYEIQTAGKDALAGDVVGLDRSMSFFKTINCLKGIHLQLQNISNSISSPLQNITAENNPLIKQEKKEPPS